MSKKVNSNIRYEGNPADQTNMTQRKDVEDHKISMNGPGIVVRQSAQKFKPPSSGQNIVDETLDLQFDGEEDPIQSNKDYFPPPNNVGGIGEIRRLRQSQEGNLTQIGGQTMAMEEESKFWDQGAN